MKVKGRAVIVLGLENGAGGRGLVPGLGQHVRVELAKTLDAVTIIRWHGRNPRNAQDGRPNANPMLRPGEPRSSDFAPRPGTFWMHSPIPQQQIAPLVVRRSEGIAADCQEVTMFLHDVSCGTPEEVPAKIPGGRQQGEGAAAPGKMQHRMPGMARPRTCRGPGRCRDRAAWRWT
ncbi:multicopper oxidase domain-containing protein [Mangrovicoccus ximenensis]|uniref:multicopper oxidase domain-containing protein n=1 Tax=Mangrovicoccus ximenensis TaxID=1911570 RepID=UPI0013750E82|nr:multicopper oxidase domain-containing protein [Mangrovicoccus ximenensis]